MAITLIDLPFAKSALDPAISAETLEYHHGKHHQTYVDKTNAAIAGTDHADKTLEQVIAAARGTDKGLFNNAAQAWNHGFFWEVMAPDGGAPGEALAPAIARKFGDLAGLEPLEFLGDGRVDDRLQRRGRVHHLGRDGGEMSAQDIWALFSSTYLDSAVPLRYVGYQLTEHPSVPTGQGIRLTVDAAGVRHTLQGAGNGPIDAAVHALQTLGLDVQVRSFEERSTKGSAHGGDAQACAFMELSTDATDSPDRFGVGLDHNIVTASIKALVSGVNRLGLVPQQGVAKAAQDAVLV